MIPYPENPFGIAECGNMANPNGRFCESCIARRQGAYELDATGHLQLACPYHAECDARSEHVAPDCPSKVTR